MDASETYEEMCERRAKAIDLAISNVERVIFSELANDLSVYWEHEDGEAFLQKIRHVYGPRPQRRKGLAAKSFPIDGTKARAVYERDAYRCVNCGGYQDLTVDHKIALVNGGTHDFENLQTMCRSCNSRKGAR